MRQLKTLQDVVDWGLCVGCGACVAACASNSVRMAHVETEGWRPVFSGSCVGCSACLSVCPGAGVSSPTETKDTAAGADSEDLGPALAIFEGWATEPDVRHKASSGGVVTALSLFCLSERKFAGVLHSAMDPAKPWLNATRVSSTTAEVRASAGSRYSPSSPCECLPLAKRGDGEYLFVGKPCDVSAAASLMKSDEALASGVGLLVTFFCAGTPSTKGTLAILDEEHVNRDQVAVLHYRGDGWPGHLRAFDSSGTPLMSIPYQEAWPRLTSYRPQRCNLCPDGLGRLADISCGDAWHQFHPQDPGRSIVIARTQRGLAALLAAQTAGYLELRPLSPGAVTKAQESLLVRRRHLFGRLLARRIAGVPIPRFTGFDLFDSWRHLGLAAQIRSVAGTLYRIAQRGQFRRGHRPDIVLKDSERPTGSADERRV